MMLLLLLIRFYREGILYAMIRGELHRNKGWGFIRRSI